MVRRGYNVRSGSAFFWHSMSLQTQHIRAFTCATQTDFGDVLQAFQDVLYMYNTDHVITGS